MSETDDAARRMALYQKQGWCPVKWAHHPQIVKNIIRAGGFVPQLKACWANCQRFVLSQHPRAVEFAYCEGHAFTMIWIEHAWLLWKPHKQIIDLTLPPGRVDEYSDPIVYRTTHVLRSMARTKCFTPISDVGLALTNPLRKQMAEWFDMPLYLNRQPATKLVELLQDDGFTKAEAKKLVKQHRPRARRK